MPTLPQLCTTETEWNAVRRYRQTYFFDQLPIEDPYTWTFTHKDHRHFILYRQNTLAAYAHLQLWPEHRAALRIIVTDTPMRNQGIGTEFMQYLETWLKDHHYHSLHIESSPEALAFYTRLGYIPMPFNDPDGYESHPDDVAVGKVFTSSTHNPPPHPVQT